MSETIVKSEKAEKLATMCETALSVLESGDAKVNKMAEKVVLDYMASDLFRLSLDDGRTTADATTIEQLVGMLQELVSKGDDYAIKIHGLESKVTEVVDFIVSGNTAPFELEDEGEEEEEEASPEVRKRSNGVYVPPTPITQEDIDGGELFANPAEYINNYREKAAKQQYEEMHKIVINLETRLTTVESMGGGGTAVDAGDFKMIVPVEDKNFIISKEHAKLLGAMDEAASTRGMVCAMFEGPPSSGKSEASQQLAAKTGRQFFSINCSTVREPQQWFGSWQARDGKTFFEPSAFVKAISTGNTVIRLEELNRLDPIIQNPLLELLQDRRTHIEGLGEVRIAMNTIFTGTVNIGNQYQGTFRMCESLMSRFTQRILFKPLSEKNLVKVLVNRTGIEKGFAEKLAKVVAQVQSKCGVVGTGSYDKPITYRQAQECCHLYPNLGKEAIEYTVLNHFEADGPESDRQKAATLFAGQGLL